MLSHSFPVPCKSISSWKRYCLRLLEYIIHLKLWNALKLLVRSWMISHLLVEGHCGWLWNKIHAGDYSKLLHF
jgi:hypothetical protein